MKEVTAREIDKAVCDWTMNVGIGLTEEQLNHLVDLICEAIGINPNEGLN